MNRLNKYSLFFAVAVVVAALIVINIKNIVEHLQDFRRLAILSLYGPDRLPRNKGSDYLIEQAFIFRATADVVMVGDSITRGGNWDEMFDEVKVLNRGISGDRIDDVLSRVDSIKIARPKKIFIMGGFNDISWGKGVDRIIRDYDLLIDSLRLDGCKIFIQSTLECARERCGSKLDSIRELNIKLRSLALSKGIQFVDLNSVLSDNNGLLKEHTYDGVHLRGSGYGIWKKRLAPLIFDGI